MRLDNKDKDIPDKLSELEDYLAKRESAVSLKPDTQARIIWNSDSKPQKTEYAIIYLHGFRASHPEGHPVHRQIAKHFGYNLFLSRMEEHGIESDYPLLDLTEEKLLRSAHFAFAIGRRIGKKVIVMGTSTGGSLGLYLAANPAYQKKISALVLYSPLIRFYGVKEKLLMYPFSRALLKVIPGKKHLIKTQSTFAEDKIWDSTYALQGALALGSFMQHYMKRDLYQNITCPVFAGYYYRNKKEHDQVVSVPAIKTMVNGLGTRTQNVNITNFSEAKSHVICNNLVSKAVNEVIDETKKFLKIVVSHGSRES